MGARMYIGTAQPHRTNEKTILPNGRRGYGLASHLPIRPVTPSSTDTRMHITRRDWLLSAVSSTVWLEVAAAQEHAQQSARNPSEAKLEYLQPEDAADIADIAEPIIPSDDGPGATETGAVFFIDRALRTFDSDQQDIYRNGLRDLRTLRAGMFPAAASVAALTREQKMQLVRAIEKSEFFEAVRVHTVLGFVGDPSYCGNGGGLGWRYIGFEDRMAWQPPFGHYDAQAK